MDQDHLREILDRIDSLPDHAGEDIVTILDSFNQRILALEQREGGWRKP